MAECKTENGRDLNLISVTGQGVVQGRLLEMSLTQVFKNPEATNVEVVYTFPLPFGAVLLGIEATLNGQLLTGIVTAKAEARETYEVAISEGNTSVLLSRNHDGSYSLELGNLLAAEVCTINLKYAQVLHPEQGSLRLMLPCTIAPRYGNAIVHGKFEPHTVPTTSLMAEYPFEVSLAIKGALAKANVSSPSHPISVRSQTNELNVKLGAQSWLDRDFVLILSELSEVSCAVAAPDLLASGESVVMAGLTPLFSNVQPRKTSVKVLVDCSGSMAGDSIEAAQKALYAIVESLTSEDWFTLSKFGDTVRHRSETPWAGGAAARASAARWINGLKADMGGTEMNEALMGVLALRTNRPSDVLLITDGEIHAIDEIMATAKNSGQRMFVVGIGSSPAAGLLTRLARETGGACEFVAPGESVEPAVVRMFRRLRGPVMTDVQMVWRDAPTPRLLSNLPVNVFDGDTVTVFAKIHQIEPKEMRVMLLAREATESGSVEVASASLTWVQDDENTLARLGAEALCRVLQVELDANAGGFVNTGDVFAVVTEIAEKYQLVTDQTNFVLVHVREAHIRPEEMPELRQVAAMAAAGWSGIGKVRLNDPVGVVHCSMQSSSRMSSSGDLGRVTSSVWRTNRAVIKPLSLPTAFDDFEIPAYLRREAQNPEPSSVPIDDDWDLSDWASDGDGYSGLSPSGLVKRLLRLDPEDWPKTFAELEAYGVGPELLDWLQKNSVLLKTGPTIVSAFLLALVQVRTLESDTSFVRARALFISKPGGPFVIDLSDKLAKVISNALDGCWPVDI